VPIAEQAPARRVSIPMFQQTPHLEPPLKARLRFSSSAPNTSRIVDDKALMARTFAYLFGVGGALALATLLLPGSPDRAELAFAGVAALALLTSALFVFAYDRLPRRLFQLAPLLGNVMVAAALVLGGDMATGSYALFYFWVALAAFYFFELRWAMICGAVASITYAAVLVAQPHIELGELKWTMLTGGLFVSGVIMSRLRARAEQLVSQLSSAAGIDVLTGLPNRREFDTKTRQEVARAKRVGIEFGLVRLDVDGFQPFNDSAGHHAGDLLLQQVAHLLRREVRESDTLARIGGDEFGVIVPEAAQVDTYLLAERLRKAVREGLQGEPHALTLSAGVAIYGRHGRTPQQLSSAAEQALLAAKRLGRDRTVIFSDEVASNLLELGLGPSHELPTSLETILSLAELVDVNQMGSARHSQVVGRYAEAMAESLGLRAEQVQRIRLAGMLHDVGKIGVRGSILAKPGPLTVAEMDEMRTHPEIGARIARNAGLADIAVWIAAHHERQDGDGYPLGVCDKEIPLEARILAVGDAYEAMTNDRAYRSAMSAEKAREELRLNAGTQFDERVVEAFLALLDSEAFDELDPLGSAQESEPSLEASSTK
jgi:diguanylate cyclase (GGDEF)-like protein/putative nucleotidyltransferase with HDIG domain